MRLGKPSDAAPRSVTFRVGSHEFALISLPVAPARLPAGLTDAERAIGTAVLAGASTAEIAGQRGTSPRTVANQLAAIYRKLGVRSRAEFAARYGGSIEG
jgi:DNA-binding CsgD family transcriptional regulator